MQRLRVVIHDFPAEKELKIAEHVRDQETEEDQSRDRHDRLLADGRVIKAGDSIQASSRKYGAHECSPTVLTKPDIVTL